jgi:formylglycine-generating enzyme required for sulfatase activity
VIATLTANTTTYENTGLTAATGYTYVVSAIAPGGALVSAAGVAATTFGPTAVPTGVTATAFSSTQINLKWTDAATNETEYRIESRPTSGTTWTVLATIAANSNSYSNTGLTPSTGYTYRVSAIAPGGAAMSAATVAATTFGPTSGPTGVTATAFSSTQINLSWTDVAANETGYQIARRPTSGTALTIVTTLTANATTYQNTGLTAATGYTYIVSAIAPGGALVSADGVATTTFSTTATVTEMVFTTANVSETGVITRSPGRRTRKYEEDLGGGVKLEMVVIPGGSFQMGSPDTEVGRWSHEGPRRRVDVNGFVMGRYEVTQAQWRAVMGTDPSFFKGNNLPVERVSWDDAQEFCRRLNEKLGLTGASRYRLPSEAEWEYAARAGTATPFAFGQTVNAEIVNYYGPEPYGNAPAGVFRRQSINAGSLEVANAWGLYDMHGNTYEWCEDDYHESYSGGPTDGRAWVDSQRASDRVIRGGGWYYLSAYCRSAFRIMHAPGGSYDYVGFRLSRTLP